MNRRLPAVALLLGLVGLLPFLAGALGTLSTMDTARANQFLGALIGYGAVSLAFWGGAHWGFVLALPASDAAAAKFSREPYRLVLGIVPSLVGWLALLVLLVGAAEAALAVLAAGYVALVAAEAELRRRGLVPLGYIWLRWGVSIVVTLILATVITLRLVGARIIF
jgi:hypothetical protein